MSIGKSPSRWISDGQIFHEFSTVVCRPDENPHVPSLGQLPGKPGAGGAPDLDDGGNCHQDRQSGHDHIQPACRGCLPFSGLLMVLDGRPAGGPLPAPPLGMLSAMVVTRSRAPSPSADETGGGL